MQSGTILLCTSKQKTSQELKSLLFALGTFTVNSPKFRAVGALTVDDNCASDNLLGFRPTFHE